MRLKKKVFFYLRGILENGLGGVRNTLISPNIFETKESV